MIRLALVILASSLMSNDAVAAQGYVSCSAATMRDERCIVKPPDTKSEFLATRLSAICYNIQMVGIRLKAYDASGKIVGAEKLGASGGGADYLSGEIRLLVPTGGTIKANFYGTASSNPSCEFTVAFQKAN